MTRGPSGSAVRSNIVRDGTGAFAPDRSNGWARGSGHAACSARRRPCSRPTMSRTWRGTDVGARRTARRGWLRPLEGLRPSARNDPGSKDGAAGCWDPLRGLRPSARNDPGSKDGAAGCWDPLGAGSFLGKKRPGREGRRGGELGPARAWIVPRQGAAAGRRRGGGWDRRGGSRGSAAGAGGPTGASSPVLTRCPARAAWLAPDGSPYSSSPFSRPSSSIWTKPLVSNSSWRGSGPSCWARAATGANSRTTDSLPWTRR